MNNQVYTKVDRRLWKKKPTQPQIAKMQDDSAETKPEKIELEELVELSSKGGTFRPCALTGNEDSDFISGQLLALDYDHPERSLDDAIKQFNDMSIPPVYAYYTFNSTKDKPRFRIVFMLDEPIENVDAWRIAQLAIMSFHYEELDKRCKNPSRLWLGTTEDKMHYTNFDARVNVAHLIDVAPQKEVMQQQSKKRPQGVVIEGERVNTLIKTIGSFIRSGIPSGDIRTAVISVNETFNPPLTESELEREVFPALKRWEDEIGDNKLVPRDITDVSEARAFLNYDDNQAIVRYTNLGFMYFNGVKWDTNAELKIKKKFIHFVDSQIRHARKMRDAEQKKADKMQDIVKDFGATESASKSEAQVKYWKNAIKKLLMYHNNTKVDNVIKALKSMIYTDISAFDSNPNLLNTPEGTVDLKTGKLREHSPSDYITKCTSSSPSEDNNNMWLDHLYKVSCENENLIDYHQIVCGSFLFGKVYDEKLTVAYGFGANGKSTMYEAITKALGDYAGHISPDTLIHTKKNTSPEYAELRGKRFVVASELDDGQSLNTAALKRLCSTDTIRAEAKYMQPFDFRPSHHIILFTNHLPRTNATDRGTYRRITIIPFLADFSKMEGGRNNYADVLYREAGGAILNWLIGGAVEFSINDFCLPEPPEVVKEAIDDYRKENDWLKRFIDDCIIIRADSSQGSAVLYDSYRSWALDQGEYIRNSIDFKRAMEGQGFIYKRTQEGVKVLNIALKGQIFYAADKAQSVKDFA